ncbi:cupin domain-containing protein [Parashewanella tropica]|uniref:cupin domain-containing protein n=1 Tax=Parashewanella tropica TaxID=2547970 RepID=UPI00105A9946|nr:cupin domain-containing protein [Parashewanella tropica]
MSHQKNTDLSRFCFESTEDMAWESSPSTSVFRKRLHLSGEKESGRVTSMVQYLPNSHFPSHPHPDGEEIFVLEGTFSDEHGDWSAGSYLLNPEGIEHQPFSKEGCTIFVKLRQYSGVGRKQLQLDTKELTWQPTSNSQVQTKLLYQQKGFIDITRLEKWGADTQLEKRSYQEGAEIYVISGSLYDENGTYPKGSWLRFPKNYCHIPATEEGCTIYIKTGGIEYIK